VTLAAIAGDGVINAAERAAPLTLDGSADVEDGQTVTVTLGGKTYTAPVVDGRWSLDVPADDVANLGEGGHTVTAEVSDRAGNAARPATGTVVVDTQAPTIAIDAIAGDGVINAAESGQPLTIGGSTDADDGQTVTVTLGGKTYTGAVSGGRWSVDVPAADVAALGDGDQTVTAAVSDPAGNAATPATRVVGVDGTAPTIAIDVIAADDVINAAERGQPLTLDGSTDAGDGQTVTVTFGGKTYTGTATDHAPPLAVVV
jgi:hypothetical protein